MKRLEVFKKEDWSEKSIKVWLDEEREFFIPKSSLIKEEKTSIIVEDWILRAKEEELDIQFDAESVSLYELLEYTPPKAKYLTGVEYIYNPLCFELQNEAIEFCVKRKHALINLYTGAGKTFIYLGIIDALKKDKNFIVCPPKLISQMKSEIKKFFPHLESKIELIKYSDLSLNKFDTNKITSDSVLIFDEAHRIKNSLNQNEPELIDLALRMAYIASYVYAGTATPSPNGEHDLLGIMRIIHPDLRELKKNRLIAKYGKIGGRGFNIVGLKNILEFCEIVMPYIFYRNRENYENIPQLFKDYPVYLNESQSFEYMNAFKKHNYTNIFAVCQEMKKALYDCTKGGQEKCEILKKLCEENDQQKIIFVDTVFAENNEFEQVCRTLGFENCAFLCGGKNTLESFINGEKKYLICSYGSGSEGLNLQFCSTIIFYGHNFNFMHKYQSFGRIRRYGQNEICKYYNIFYKNSIEGSYLKSIERKANIMEEYNNAFDKAKFTENLILGG